MWNEHPTFHLRLTENHYFGWRSFIHTAAGHKVLILKQGLYKHLRKQQKQQRYDKHQCRNIRLLMP